MGLSPELKRFNETVLNVYWQSFLLKLKYAMLGGNHHGLRFMLS